MRSPLILCLVCVCLTSTLLAQTGWVVLLDDDFSHLRPGMFSAGEVGAHMEYRYLPASLGQGNWQVSCFKSESSQRAWRVIRDRGDAMMAAMYVLYGHEGGLYDGLGRRVVNFPADGHPELCNAVMDVTGDCRDEIVVWDACKMWVYTQDDNPKRGKLYKPQRSPQYNTSNYQATVSLPGWSK